MSYKKTITQSVAVFMVAGLLTPMTIFAQGANSAGNSGVQGNICERTENVTERIENRFKNMEEMINEKRERIQERVENRHEEQKQSREKLRERVQEQREEPFAEMREQAETKEQQEAVETYITTVTNAYELHDSNATAVLNESRNADKLTLQYYTVISDALSEYETTILEAVEKAKKDCENDVDIKDIRDELREINNQARNTYRETKGNSADSIKDEIQTIVDGARGELEQSRNTLRNSLQKAQEALRNALQNNASNNDATE
ncbi:MAG: hypothetical protein KAI72_09315 [Candidatus Pacebacteria bacterium]|nr:hypothetical protein [Candidatus Paceibacterota bacterium]